MSTLNVCNASVKNSNNSSHLTLETRAIVKYALYVDLIKYQKEKHSEKTNKSFIRYFSAKTNISQTSIFNFMKKEDQRIPTNENLYKIYSAIYDTNDLNVVKNKLNPVINKYLEDSEINNNAINEAILKHENKFNPVILANDIRKSIYFLTSDSGCTLDYIKSEYGKRGIEELEELVAIDAVRVSEGWAKRGGVYLQKNTKDGNQLLSSLIKNHGPNEESSSPCHQKYYMGNLSIEATRKIQNELRLIDEKITRIIKEDNENYKNNSQAQTEKMFYSTVLSVAE